MSGLAYSLDLLSATDRAYSIHIDYTVKVGSYTRLYYSERGLQHYSLFYKLLVALLTFSVEPSAVMPSS